MPSSAAGSTLTGSAPTRRGSSRSRYSVSSISCVPGDLGAGSPCCYGSSSDPKAAGSRFAGAIAGRGSLGGRPRCRSGSRRRWPPPAPGQRGAQPPGANCDDPLDCHPQDRKEVQRIKLPSLLADRSTDVQPALAGAYSRRRRHCGRRHLTDAVSSLVCAFQPAREALRPPRFAALTAR